MEYAGDLPCGSALLIAHHADVTFGNVLVEPLGGNRPSPESQVGAITVFGK